MKTLGLFCGLLTAALPATCGDVSGQVLITKRITKNTVALAPYDMRGMVMPSTPSELAPESEFDRTIVMLEGGSLTPKPPVTMLMRSTAAGLMPPTVRFNAMPPYTSMSGTTFLTTYARDAVGS